MKKLFALLVIALSAIGASGQGVYMVQEGDKFTQGDVITSVSNITLTLSPDGGYGGHGGTGEYADGKATTNWVDPDFVAFTVGSVNGKVKLGESISGTYYQFEPKRNGTLTVGAQVNGSKAFWVLDKDYNKITDYTYNFPATEDEESQTFTQNKKGEDVLAAKTNGTVTFDVEAGGTYYVMVSGSKMGFFGFKYSINATVGTAGYATFCSTATCKVPSGLTAYTAAYNATSGKVDLTEVADGIIPANNGVILKGEAKEYTMETATSEVKPLDGNKLKGVTADYTLTDKDYILVNDGGVVKFGKATVGTTLAAGKVYLPIENPNAAKIINMDFDGTTGINAVETASDKDDAYYTLSGVKTLKPTKGMLYIHNGKKYIAK